MTQAAPSRLQFSSARLVLQALQALSAGTKQTLRVTLTASGLQFRCEDNGKVCQSWVRFPRGFFTSFQFSGTPATFSLQLSVLADVLKLFAALPPVTVSVATGPDHLHLELSETEGPTSTCMYAHIGIQTSGHVTELTDLWQPPTTEFTTDTVVLREAIEDMEWPQGFIRLSIHARPFQVTLSSQGPPGSLEVRLAAGHTRQQRTHKSTIGHSYPFKFLKSALTGVGGMKGHLSTRLAIDSNGLLKVVHILPGASTGVVGAADATQVTAAGSADVVLTYAIQPLADDVLDDDY